jgi:glycosyltransferase involved in cell wall biosynthesis
VTNGLQSLRKILVLAPQPFFQNRGTPIAIKLLVTELAALGHDVHLLVFHEGENVVIPGVTIHRTPKIPGVHHIPPSISAKKIVCDLTMFFRALMLLRKNRFDIIHAIEEAVFMAKVLGAMFHIPYIYDMDSSLPIQIVDKLAFCRPIKRELVFFEKMAVRSSFGVVAVCRALEDIAVSYAPGKLVARLEDVSLLEDSRPGEENLREKYGISGPIMLYVGNLEGYQGIDLLLEGFQQALERGCNGNVVIIGGTESTIASYKRKAEQLGISERTYFCGPRPVELLGHYLQQADILLSPRVQGNNTPMKLYSYLDSGKAVLATNLATHTQVLNDDFACLVEPTRESMGQGMEKLLNDVAMREELGRKGREIARENYSLKAFREKLRGFYAKVVEATAG